MSLRLSHFLLASELHPGDSLGSAFPFTNSLLSRLLSNTALAFGVSFAVLSSSGNRGRGAGVSLRVLCLSLRGWLFWVGARSARRCQGGTWVNFPLSFLFLMPRCLFYS